MNNEEMLKTLADGLVKSNRPKKSNFSKYVVAGVIALNVVFAGLVLAVYWHTGSEPATLIVSWFAFTTGELWALGKIKRNEINKGGQGDGL